ncbi:MAG: hypothetical protein ACRDWI_18965 [Jiangellaceae bacterium]
MTGPPARAGSADGSGVSPTTTGSRPAASIRMPPPQACGLPHDRGVDERPVAVGQRGLGKRSHGTSGVA